MRPLFYLACFALLAAFGDVHYFAVKEGNEKYRAGDYAAAEKQYADARQQKDSDTARHNLGAALYRQKKYEEAAKLFGSAAESKDAVAGKAALNYANAQNALGGERLKKGDAGAARQNLEDAVAAYRKTLLADPSKISAKHNMEIALKRLEELKDLEQKKEKREQNGQGKKDPKNGNDKQPDKGNNKDGEPQQGEGQPGAGPGGMKKEQADRVLANLARREEKEQRDMRRFKMQEREVEKDW
ncbi:MAG: tetratricopeptide repeat protein [Nitrospinae bacterium]|nr:tetratricopeptide repeat protein [Nitrospinota bacterium]